MFYGDMYHLMLYLNLAYNFSISYLKTACSQQCYTVCIVLLKTVLYRTIQHFDTLYGTVLYLIVLIYCIFLCCICSTTSTVQYSTNFSIMLQYCTWCGSSLAWSIRSINTGPLTPTPLRAYIPLIIIIYWSIDTNPT